MSTEPTATDDRLHLRLSSVEKERFRRRAKADGRTLSNWALQRLRAAVKAEEAAELDLPPGSLR